MMGSSDEEIGIFVCDAIQRVFKGDKLGDVSYEVVKTLASELKVKFIHEYTVGASQVSTIVY